MRFCRILLSTIFCVVLFLSGAFLLTKWSEIESALEPIGAAIFLLFFLIPYTVPGIAAHLVVLSLMDQRGLRRPWHYALAWTIVGGCVVVLPEGSDAARLLGALPFLAVTGVVYWALAGRLAGQPETLFKGFADWSFTVQISVGIGLALAALALRWIFFESLKTIGPM